jgi:hypothetical protein
MPEITSKTISQRLVAILGDFNIVVGGIQSFKTSKTNPIIYKYLFTKKFTIGER